MLRPLICSLCGLLVVAASATAFETQAKIKKIDAEKRVLVLTGPGRRDHTVRIAKDAKVLDEKGKDLADGIKSERLKEGTEATVTVEKDADDKPVIKVIQLGKRRLATGPGQAPPKIDTSKLQPLTDMGKNDEYQGFKGGLYPAVKNERPAEHEAAGVELAQKVQPLDADGKPSPDGKIVLLSVGMSNTSQAFTAFQRLANADQDKNPKVVLVNGAQGGMTAASIQNPEDNKSGTKYWTTVDERLKAAGVTAEQVQVVWIKQADAGPDQGFPKYAKTLQAELAKIVQVLAKRYPNVKLCYLSSRTYGGYAKTRLNPEPYAYASGFSVKWLIEEQIKGDPALNYNPAKGEVKAPWLSWGAYLWANGTTKRADGFRYEESDFAERDGTHESPSGEKKVGQLLLQFFKTDTTTRPWFVKNASKGKEN